MFSADVEHSSRKIPPRCDELVAVGWRTFTAKGEGGESVRAVGIRCGRIATARRSVV